jgi:hypothetical protein
MKRELEERRRANPEIWRQIESDRRRRDNLAKEYRRLNASIEHGMHLKEENERQIRYLERSIEESADVVVLVCKMQQVQREIKKQKKKIRKISIRGY